MIRRSMALICVAVLTILTGCATTGGMRSAPLTEGVSRTFKGDYDRVLKAARESVVEAGLAIDEVNKVDDKTWMIISKKGASAFSWGEMIRVVVQGSGTDETAVRVMTQRKVATNVTAKGDYSTSILSNMELKLK